MLKVTNLSKIFRAGKKEIRAVDDVSFHISKGSFTTITGKSGSGKSTLLYQLGLLDTPTSGEIYLSGNEVATLSTKEKSLYRLKNLGYVFQNYALIPTLSAAENVYLPLIMMGFDKNTAKRVACNTLTEVGLAERFNNLPGQLSGGEQQRVSIARAIANKPDILFADEPTANLDTETSKVILNVLKKLNKKGLTIVMVTHEPDYAKLGDTMLKMSDGKIVSTYN